MEDIFIKTAKIIYENEGDCIDINRCEDCPFDKICDLYITDETKFELAKELLKKEGIELPIINSELIITEAEMKELYINGIRISYDKQKNVKVKTENNSIIIKLLEE